MPEFEITLQARAQERNICRFYHVEVTIDLLGEWLVDIWYGRIGAIGHHSSYSAVNEPGAKSIVLEMLKRRDSSKKRIGVNYLVKELNDPHAWTDARS